MHRLKMQLSKTTVKLLITTEEFDAQGLLYHISSAHWLTIQGLLNDNPSPYYSDGDFLYTWLTDIAQHPKFQPHLHNACAAFKQRPSDVGLVVEQLHKFTFSAPFHDNQDGSLSVHVIDFHLRDAVAYAAVCSWLSSVDLLPVLGIRFQHFLLG
jgi:hypothetical protein